MTEFCKDCGSRVYKLGCINCDEDRYIAEMDIENEREERYRQLDREAWQRESESSGV